MRGRVTQTTIHRMYETLAGPLVLYARNWLDRAHAEEIVQDAFVSLIEQQSMPDNPRAWMFRVVRNQAVSRVRQTQRRRQREQTPRASQNQRWFSAEANDLVDSANVQQHLRDLPADVREVVVLRIWGGLNFVDIASIQHCSTATAHRRFADGLSSLRRFLEASCQNTKT